MRYEEMPADEKLKYVVSLVRGNTQPCSDCEESLLVSLHPHLTFATKNVLIRGYQHIKSKSSVSMLRLWIILIFSGWFLL
jgi:hypothetical protein